MCQDRGCNKQYFFCLNGLYFHKHVVLEKALLHKEAYGSSVAIPKDFLN